MAYKVPITNTSKPSCEVYNSSTLSAVTGDATNYTIAFESELWDYTSNYNTGTYTFTAPITGVYTVTLSVLYAILTTSHTGSLILIGASNRNITNNQNAGFMENSSQRYCHCFTVDVDMDASDTITFTASVSGSTKTIDIAQGTGINLRSYASIRQVF